MKAELTNSKYSIRNRLTALKKDRTEYIRAKDVLDIYSALMDQGEPSPIPIRARTDELRFSYAFERY